MNWFLRSISAKGIAHNLTKNLVIAATTGITLLVLEGVVLWIEIPFSWFVLAAGLLITAVLVVLLLLITVRADMISRLVKEKTQEILASRRALEESNRLKNTILDSAVHMIIAF